MLNDMFNAFDALCDKHGVAKVEIIGDGYLCVCGHRPGFENHPDRMLSMALDMIAAVRRIANPLEDSMHEHIEIRVGINTGPLSGGIVGEKLPKWTVFGNTVNIASRMESGSLPMNIMVTKETCLRITTGVEFIKVPARFVKGIGKMRSYAVKSQTTDYEAVYSMIEDLEAAVELQT